jgi:catechol 2,3-dioxygenase
MFTPLPPNTHIANAHLKVTNLNRSLAFYTNTLGFYAHTPQAHQAELSASPEGITLIHLLEHANAQPKPRHTTGLFHIAIRVPSRSALAQVVRRLHEQQWPLLGASDHGVSEALYLNDPDGNGLEIYTDLPRSQWPTQGEQVAMYSAPLNVQNLLQESTERSDTHLPASTDLGHIHLQVSSLATAKQFYCDLIGFDVRQDNYKGALFVAADGYHHHLGLNTWASEGAPAPPTNSVGLDAFTIAIPNTETLEAISNRFEKANITFTQTPNQITTQDTDHNTLILSLS